MSKNFLNLILFISRKKNWLLKTKGETITFFPGVSGFSLTSAEANKTGLGKVGLKSSSPKNILKIDSILLLIKFFLSVSKFPMLSKKNTPTSDRNLEINPNFILLPRNGSIW